MAAEGIRENEQNFKQIKNERVFYVTRVTL